MDDSSRGPAATAAQQTSSSIVVRVLGPVGVIGSEVRNGGPLDIGGVRPRRLLAALAVEAGQAVTIDRLADRVWGDLQPADPKGALYTLVARLRQALGADAIVTTDSGYRLGADGDAQARVSLDSSRFTALVERAGRPAIGVLERLDLLDTALGLWRGPAYDGMAELDWARAEADRLEELRAVAMERRFEAMLAAGKHTDATVELAAAVEEFPLRDKLVGQQMLALFRSGRQAEAARAFQAHRSRLATELGLAPGEALVELDRRIVAGDASLHLDATGSIPGRALRGYRLGEQLGEGAFAVVFRGTQPSVGRDVAIKVIRAELANRPEFVRGFEVEAHLVAHLEHPHIVPLYDYWREPDRACLVFRYLRGGSLESRLASAGRVDVAEARTLVAQLGGALATAHRAGVVHRDVKPANVFLDDAGNFYLGDFGIALGGADLADPTAALSAGSPAYAAPEQLRREPIGPAADIYGLGITTYEALTGQLPFPGARTHAELLQRQLHDALPAVRALRHDVPPALDGVLARATAKRPNDRFADIGAFVEAFEAAFATGGETPTPSRRGAVTVPANESRNPYKGLRSFTEADVGDFRGRERLVGRLVTVLSRTDSSGRIATVVGPSGIGKSSAVRAGLVPAVRKGAIPGSERWYVAAMLPGRDPFDELAAALLRIATHATVNLTSELTQDQRGLSRVVKALVTDGELLLIIDQFEEVFTLCDDPTMRRRFLDLIEYAVTDARCPLRVVLTMRADFYDRPLRFGSFARLIEPSTVPVTALAPDELEAAIVEPAAAVGCEFEPGLLSEIVADVGDQPGALPLLQYALTELYELRVSGLLTRDAYATVGGVAGALARRAEDLTEAATDDEHTATRRLFGHLVTLGEGTEDTRRRLNMAQLSDASAMAAVIERFGAARLLSFDRDPDTREPTVEIAHEALIRQWPRLRDWLDEDRDDLRLHRQLDDAARNWDRGGRDEGDLYRGGRLESAEAWAARHPDELGTLPAEFLAASIHRRDQERAASLREVRRLRSAVAGVAVIAAVALVAGLLAWGQQRRANDEAARNRQQTELAINAAAVAETRRLVADATALSSENRDVALLLASEAYRREPDPKTLAGLQRVLTNTGPFLGTIGAGNNFLAAHMQPDGTVVGVTDQDIRFYDGATWQQTRVVPLPSPMKPIGKGVPVAFDDHTVAVGTDQGSVFVLDDSETRTIDVSTSPIRSVALGPGVIAAGSTDGLVHLAGVSGGAERWATQVILQHTYREVVGEERWAAIPPGLATFLEAYADPLFQNGPVALRFTPDGSLITLAGVHLRRLDVGTGQITAELLTTNPESDLPAYTFAIEPSPSGGWYLSGANFVAEADSNLTTASVSPVATGRTDDNIGVTAMTTDADGQPWFALDNGQLTRGTAQSALEARDNPATGLSDARGLRRTPDGRRLLVAGAGGIILWAADGRQLLAQSAPRAQNTQVDINPSGTRLVLSTLNSQQPTVLYDLTADPPQAIDTSTFQPGRTYAIGADPLERYIDEFDSGTLRMLDAESFTEVTTINDTSYTQYSHDGNRYTATAWTTPRFHVFDVATWEPISPMLDLTPWATDLQRSLPTVVPGFDPTGAHVFASIQESGTTVVFETTTWQPSIVIEPSDHGGVVAAGFSRDGTTLITLGVDGTISVRDPHTWAYQRPIAGGITSSDSLGYGLSLSADGQYLVTTRDARPRLWHVPTATLIGSFPHQTGMSAAGNGYGDQLRLVTLLGEDALTWNLDVSSWPGIACRAAGRNLTKAEWDQFGPKDTPYHATCAQWPVSA